MSPKADATDSSANATDPGTELLAYASSSITTQDMLRKAEVVRNHLRQIVEKSSSVLLTLEWSLEGSFCPVCKHTKPHHAIGCDLDLALAERGFTTPRNRDAARDCLRLSESSQKDTIPAPPIDSD